MFFGFLKYFSFKILDRVIHHDATENVCDECKEINEKLKHHVIVHVKLAMTLQQTHSFYSKAVIV